MTEFKAIAHDGKSKPEGNFFWVRFRNGNDAAGDVNETYRWVWDEQSQDPYDIVEYSH